MRGALALPAAAALALALAGCGNDAASDARARDPRPDVVLISLDTTRADHTSAYGYARDTTPVLRAVAEQGVRFDLAYAPSATTGPSHASLFTAVDPIRHGVLKNGHRLAPELDTLAETLAAAGYDTAAVVSSFVLARRFGYAQGFAHFDDDLSRAEAPLGPRHWEGLAVDGPFEGRADDTTRRALAWLDARAAPERPFLLFVHYYDPHSPYAPPDGFAPPFPLEPAGGEDADDELARTILRYDAEIAYMDAEIGRLLDGLGARGADRDLLLLVAGDHGEGLMQHGAMYHGVHIYEEGVRVPLIARWPGRAPAGGVVAEPVSLIDLAPSVLELVGAEAPDAFRGASFAGALLGAGALDPQRPIHLYRRHYDGDDDRDADADAGGEAPRGEKYGLRRGRWKLIEGPAERTLELFDLAADPRERMNVAGREPERVERLRAEIAAWRRANPPLAASSGAPLDDDERARLEALGYGQ